MRVGGKAVVLGVLTVLGVVGLVPTALAAQIDNPDGPLSRIQITEDLNCDVGHLADAYPEFFERTACGTFLSAGGSVYGPDKVPGGHQLQSTAYEPIDQSLTGTGSATDPWIIETDVAAGPDFTVHQTDSYISGDNGYRTDMQVTNHGSAATEIVLYHAGDCFLQNDDRGFGRYYAETGTIACVAPDPESFPPVPGERVLQFVPSSPGSNYMYSNFYNVWKTIGSGLPLVDDCERCQTYRDNAAGLSWTLTVQPGESITRSLVTNFAAEGYSSISTAMTADDPTPPPGGVVGIEVTLTNPNERAVNVRGLLLNLPEGAAYVLGSTSGALSEDPIDLGLALLYGGPVRLPPNGDASFRFKITAPETPGPATINFVTADAGPAPVLPSEVTVDVQPVDYLADLEVALSAPATVSAGDQVTWSTTVINHGPATARPISLDLQVGAPAGQLTDPVAPPGWECTPHGTAMTCTTDGPLEAGASVAVTARSTVDPGAPATVVTATAQVASEVPDPDPANNETTTDVAIVRSADLHATLSGPATALPGAPVQLTAGVTNDGPSTATGVTGRLSTGWSWQLGDLAPGGSATRMREVTFDQPGTYEVTFSVSAAEDDPDDADNVAVLTIEVAGSPAPTLPPTGSGGAAGLALWALGAVVAGSGLVVGARARLRSPG